MEANNNQLRTSRKFKLSNLKNINAFINPEVTGVSLKPYLNSEAPLFKINKGNISVRQSYDTSQNNISLRNLNSNGSKKSMRSQQNRRRKSGEDSARFTSGKKSRDSRLFKKSMGKYSFSLHFNRRSVLELL